MLYQTAVGEVNVTYHPISFDDLYFEDLETIKSWCRLPYRNYKGCRNAKDCSYFRNDLQEVLREHKRLYLVWCDWNLEEYAIRMKKKHPEWSDRNCRNLLRWQSSLKSTLRKFIESRMMGCTPYWNAEGGGVNFYRTMPKFGVPLELPRDLKKVRLIVVVGC